jgi:ComF family protein
MIQLQKILTACLNLIFPPACLYCRKMLQESSLLLCEDCFGRLEFIERPFCSCCGKVFLSSGDNHLCGACLQSPWFFHQARSLFIYDKIIERLIYDLKYAGETTGIETIQKLRNESTILSDLISPDLIIPVPLHLQRLRKRGFNQAALLAKAFFPNEKGKIRFDILIRKTNTPSQTGLSGKERRQNLKGAFFIKNPEEIAGKNIVLIDDVFTTGSTVNECAKALKQARAKRIDVVTLCRVRNNTL